MIDLPDLIRRADREAKMRKLQRTLERAKFQILFVVVFVSTTFVMYTALNFFYPSLQ